MHEDRFGEVSAFSENNYFIMTDYLEWTMTMFKYLTECENVAARMMKVRKRNYDPEYI